MTRCLFVSSMLLWLCSMCPSSSQAAIVIDINYTGDSKYAQYFADAASTWQTLLTGYQNGVVVNRSNNSSYNIGQTVTTVFIDAQIAAIDGVGKVLGAAGPDEVVLDAANFTLATDGSMLFDLADVDNLVLNNRFTSVVLHEMAHVLGFGTLWTNNNVYVTGSGEFTGANATLIWQTEFGQTGTPDVELEGGDGTRDAHWNEVVSGAGLVGITNGSGLDMQQELMTGWLNNGSQLTNLTLASFRDIGFTTAANVNAVPEPTGLAILALLGIPAGRAVRLRMTRKR